MDDILDAVDMIEKELEDVVDEIEKDIDGIDFGLDDGDDVEWLNELKDGIDYDEIKQGVEDALSPDKVKEAFDEVGKGIKDGI